MLITLDMEGDVAFVAIYNSPLFKKGLPRMTAMASSSGISKITKSVKIVVLATTTGTSSQMPIGKAVYLSAICREISVAVNLSSSSLR